jgi:putative transposase
VIAFIDDHRQAYGVEPICRVLLIAPSTYHAHAARRADPSRLPGKVRRDADLKIEIRRIFEENFRVYGVRKIWRQLRREGLSAARCTVARLMWTMGLRGAIRGKRLRTTISDKAVACPLDHVNRQFHASAPDRLWLADFTYVATWTGFVYVAFVIDAYARRIVGWRASRTAHADFVLDALEQALHDRRPASRGGLVHHSDRGAQGGFKRSSQHLNEGGCVEPSKAPITPFWTGAAAVTGTAASSGAI